MKIKLIALFIMLTALGACVLAVYMAHSARVAEKDAAIESYIAANELNVKTFNRLSDFLIDCAEGGTCEPDAPEFKEIQLLIGNIYTSAESAAPPPDGLEGLYAIVVDGSFMLKELELVFLEYVNINRLVKPEKFFFANSGSFLLKKFIERNGEFDKALGSARMKDVELLPYRRKKSPARKRGKNVIVILVDTLRSDSLEPVDGVYPAPFINKLCAGGACFRNAVSQSSLTYISVASIFTGTRPEIHDDRVMKMSWDNTKSLVEEFRKNGYTTAGISTNSTVSQETGFDYGFDWFSDRYWSHAGVVNLEVERFFKTRRDAGKNLFMYIHYIDPHAPYLPPGIDVPDMDGDQATERALMTDPGLMLNNYYKKGIPLESRFPGWMFDALSDNYRKEIVFVDSQIKELFGYLEREQADVLANSVVVIVSDHGEEFMEHGALNHARTLYDEVLRVPLVIWTRPEEEGVSGSSIDRDVSLVELMPTLMDMAGVPAPERVSGMNLFNDVPDAQPVFSYLPFAYSMKPGSGGHNIAAVRKGTEKVIHDFNTGETEYYDISEDAGERENLYRKFPERADLLYELLAEWKNTPPAERSGEVDPSKSRAVEKQLKSLGYIE